MPELTPRAPGDESPNQRRARLVKEIRKGMQDIWEKEGSFDQIVREIQLLGAQSSHYFSAVDASIGRGRVGLPDIAVDDLTNLKMEVTAHRAKLKKVLKQLETVKDELDYFDHQTREKMMLAWQEMYGGTN